MQSCMSCATRPRVSHHQLSGENIGVSLISDMFDKRFMAEHAYELRTMMALYKKECMMRRLTFNHFENRLIL